ncbi:MAG: hypothetical protein ACR2ND_08865 [Solirubrobacteraceae bacterium]
MSAFSDAAARNRLPRFAFAATFTGSLVVLIALLAGFGWLDGLRSLGVLGAGPRVADALPLRRLAGDSAQPLSRVILAWGSVGLVAGVALAGIPRAVRLGVLALSGLVLLSLASDAAYAVEETQRVAGTLTSRLPGAGVALEAAVFALAGAAAPTTRSLPHRARTRRRRTFAQRLH